MKVNEIFTSIDGEGIRTGLPTTFIRLYGCNLNCSYCDTRYSCEDDEYVDMDVDEVVKLVTSLKGPESITLTGGEPLIHSGVNELIDKLGSLGYQVNIETNGSIPIPNERKHGEFYTVDFKCGTSGMKDRMIESAFLNLRYTDVIKFVVGSLQDLEDMKHLVSNIHTDCQIFVSPVFGQIEPKDIVKYILDNKLYNVRTQVQLHKIIWNPQERGV